MTFFKRYLVILLFIVVGEMVLHAVIPTFDIYYDRCRDNHHGPNTCIDMYWNH